MPTSIRVSSRNARFQQWQALLTNRHKRQRSGEFLVQGVRPITMAVRNGWPLRVLIYDDRKSLSRWAEQILQSCDAPRVAMAPELLRELGEKADAQPELVAVAAMPPDHYTRIPVRPEFLGVVFDRPSVPGNIGTLVRSADAFGAAGVIVTGHAADPYDPKSVRASTGSLFSVPLVRDTAPQGVLAWVDSLRSGGLPVVVAGTDEDGTVDITGYDLTQPVLIVVGNETTGLSSAWRDACDAIISIPIAGSASSLNVASAGTIALYEASRQRRMLSSKSTAAS